MYMHKHTHMRARTHTYTNKKQSLRLALPSLPNEPPPHYSGAIIVREQASPPGINIVCYQWLIIAMHYHTI